MDPKSSQTDLKFLTVPIKKILCEALILIPALALCLPLTLAAQTGRVYLPLLIRDSQCQPLVFSAFGDSITSCYFDSFQGNFPNCGYPLRVRDRLVAAYQREFAFYNNGVGGEGTDGGLSRFQLTINAPSLSCVDPTGSSTSCLYPANTSNRQVGLIIILEGVNDLGGLTPYDFIEANLRAMVTIALQNKLPVVMATILPVTSKSGEDRTAQAQRIYEFNPRIAQIAIDFQIPLVDFYSAFVNTPNWENLLITDDGLHPNDQGFELMTDVLLRVILPLLTTEGCYSG